MQLKTKVKASNITNLSDARYCAGMGVDWLSFPIDSVNPTLFKEITDWVTGPELVLEVSDAASLEMIRQYPVSTLETNITNLMVVDQFGDFEWIVSLNLSDWTNLHTELISKKEKVKRLVIDFDKPNPHDLNEMAQHFLILVKHSKKHVLTDLLKLPIEGINISGEQELKPGLKDFEQMAMILEELEVND